MEVGDLEAWGGEAAYASNLAAFLEQAGAKVLIGVPVTCDGEADERLWNSTKNLLQHLRPIQVMGLSIGNEVDILQFDEALPADCLKEFWEEAHFWARFVRLVAEFDALGFDSVPVTSAFTGLALDGAPFYEVAGKARIKTFLTNATSTYGDRFTLTMNLDPYNDPTLSLDAGTDDQCSQALAFANCWDSACAVPTSMRNARRKMQELTGGNSWKLWLGKIGWESARTGSSTPVKPCRAWSSSETFENFYQGFLAWDLEIGEGLPPPDHVFFSAMRDRHYLAKSETGISAGLVTTADEPRCKIRSPDFKPWKFAQLLTAPEHAFCQDPPIYDGSASRLQTCENRCVLNEDCKYYSWYRYPSVSGYVRCILTRTCDDFGTSSAYSANFEILEKQSPVSSTQTTTPSASSPSSSSTLAPTTTEAALTSTSTAVLSSTAPGTQVPSTGACTFVHEPSFPGYFWDPSCKMGRLGCNADGVNVECRFCGDGAFASIDCPPESCQFDLDPEVPYFWDATCEVGMLGCWADGIHPQCRFCGEHPYTGIQCPEVVHEPPAAACDFAEDPATPHFWDPQCTLGMPGCLADGKHLGCRFCGRGDFASVPCPVGEAARQCSFANEPLVPYFWDPTCSYGQAGCMADGIHVECRFCAHRPFEDISCPSSVAPPPGRCSWPEGSEPKQQHFWDQSCEAGILGCWADGVHAQCRFCGSGVFANVTCPASDTSQPAAARSSAVGGVRGFAAKSRMR